MIAHFIQRYNISAYIGKKYALSLEFQFTLANKKDTNKQHAYKIYAEQIGIAYVNI